MCVYNFILDTNSKFFLLNFPLYLPLSQSNTSRFCLSNLFLSVGTNNYRLVCVCVCAVYLCRFWLLFGVLVSCKIYYFSRTIKINKKIMMMFEHLKYNVCVCACRVFATSICTVRAVESNIFDRGKSRALVFTQSLSHKFLLLFSIYYYYYYSFSSWPTFVCTQNLCLFFHFTKH